MGLYKISLNELKELIKEELTKEDKKSYPPLRSVEVGFDNGDVLTTSMASGLTDEEIKDYYKVGREFNLGHISDNMQKVKYVKILK